MMARLQRRMLRFILFCPAFLIVLSGTADARTIVARVVAMEQVVMYNRLGAWNPFGMMYALRRDVVLRVPVGGYPIGTPIVNTTLSDGQLAGNVALRPDKRPRPIVLRMNAGDTLEVRFSNLLSPFRTDLESDIPATRYAGFHPMGLSPADSIDSDSSNVGRNPGGAGSLAAPGESRIYRWIVRPPRPGEAGNEGEGTFLVTSDAVTFGGEGLNQSIASTLFGAVQVEPAGSGYVRSQVTEEEMRLATRRNPDGSPMKTSDGHPVVDYAAAYPADCVNPGGIPADPGDGVWCREGKAGLPVLKMLTSSNEYVHSDLNAIIAYDADGTLDLNSPPYGKFPASTYPLELRGLRNPIYPNRLEPFREHSSIFHDEVQAIQAFPGYFLPDPILNPFFKFILNGVKDGFMINYGSGGIASEIMANRFGVGPMYDCLDCAAEEFFLSAYTVGDPAMVVDVPANFGLESLPPGNPPPPGTTGPKAHEAYYPDDPSNVFHNYINDFAKIRNVHAGPKEHHIFHLHQHQWLFNPNDDNGNYLDAQAIGPGSGYTYELSYGGGGNRNKSLGDSIFHCHFYPHFAQGMWYLLRDHDVFEPGTPLAASGGAGSFHVEPFALRHGTPALDNDVHGDDPRVPAGARARALPDGEILVGTPIPALVPIPGKAMAPMPGKVVVVAKDADGDGLADSSQAKVIDRAADGRNTPGYPFFIAGIEHTVGQRATTPVLDMLPKPDSPADGGWNGGLPRHTLEGLKVSRHSVTDPAFTSQVTRLDFSKEMSRAKPMYFPETGTDLEKAEMAYMAERCHDSYLPDGTPAPCTEPLTRLGKKSAGGFLTNGAPPAPSAPYADPCIDDRGDPIAAGVPAHFFDAQGGTGITGMPTYGGSNPRVYKGAAIQLDVVFNKLGWHFPQQRILSLWDDVAPTMNKIRPPEPLVMRLNVMDCAQYLHTNLVPKVYELDDYQVRTPTDIIGQHVHLQKFEVVSADGSGNGWNYEDGTLSPGAVQERIEAINAWNAKYPVEAVPTLSTGDPLDTYPVAGGLSRLSALPHPYFGAGEFGNPATQKWYAGARTTIQRWFIDPLVNRDGKDRGFGISFSHDHFGPSTHQQIGLYSTILAEPVNSTWLHNETGKTLGDNIGREYDPADRTPRSDGGPTSWQAAIITNNSLFSPFPPDPAKSESFREFYFEFGDFQQAYEAGHYAGVGPNNGTVPGDPTPPDGNSFRRAIAPPGREESLSPPNDPLIIGLNPDLYLFRPVCPGSTALIRAPRPCPEVIAADDPGTFVVNYRNEPLGLRIFDPLAPGFDNNVGAQTAGPAGDPAFALQSRQDRAIAGLNIQPDGAVPGFYAVPTNRDKKPGDPYTHMPRVQTGDRVRVKLQVGATEEGHNATIHGVKWTQEGSGYGLAPNSGWRNSQMMGISEQFTLNMPIIADLMQVGNSADHVFNVSASADGWWNGSWGIIRTYRGRQNDLVQLPNNPKPTVVVNASEFDMAAGQGVCPKTAPIREYDITAVAAKDVLSPDPILGFPTLVYNARPTTIPITQPAAFNLEEPDRPIPQVGGHNGPIHDPTALLYVHTADLEPATGKLKPGAPIEPVILRAAAGECVHVTLRNQLGALLELNDFNNFPGIVNRAQDDPEGSRTFNSNLVRTSHQVGLHPQLVEYDITQSDGVNVGINPVQTVPPGGMKRYVWYAGDLSVQRGASIGPANFARLVATPVEFGTANLSPAEALKQDQKGLLGQLVIEPRGSTWVNDVDDPSKGNRSRASATVTKADGTQFRDFSLVWQTSPSMRFADNVAMSAIASEGAGLSEDAEDSSGAAFNYRTEPSWFRFGLPPNIEFNAWNDVPNQFQLYSNRCCDPSLFAPGSVVDADPQTPVFTVPRGMETRIRVGEPAGRERNVVFNLHGHMWQRQPYLAGTVPSQTIGDNPFAFYRGGQEGIGASSHFDVVLESAGGPNAVPGDYLFRDQTSFGNYKGSWGILRVTDSRAAPAPVSTTGAGVHLGAPTLPPADAGTTPTPGTTQVTSPGPGPLVGAVVSPPASGASVPRPSPGTAVPGPASATASSLPGAERVALAATAGAWSAPPQFLADPGITGIVLLTDVASPQPAGVPVTFSAAGTGGNGSYEYRYLRKSAGAGWTVVRPYDSGNAWTWDTAGSAPGPALVRVEVRTAGKAAAEFFAEMPYEIR